MLQFTVGNVWQCFTEQGRDCWRYLGAGDWRLGVQQQTITDGVMGCVFVAEERGIARPQRDARRLMRF